VNLADAVVDLGRRVAAAGLVVGSGGNVSARVGPDEVLITPTGRRLDQLQPSDLVSIGVDGEPLRPAETGRPLRSGHAGRPLRSGHAGRPSSESPMHVAAHRARPDLGFVVHAHPPKANVLAAVGRPIRLLTLDHAYYVRRFEQVPYLPSGSPELGAAVADRLATVDVVLLTHHGCLVVAADADLAFERVANVEAAAAATFDAILLGDTETVCPPEYLARVEAQERATS
jgi:L-fuculose-phosphate aldolase